MGVTISGPIESMALPWLRTPLVYVRREFGDGWTYAQQSAQFGHRFGEDWTFAPELELVRCTTHAGGQDLGTCELKRDYGTTIQPWESAWSTRLPEDLDDWWVCIMFGEALQPTRRRGTSAPAWLGQISNAPRDMDHPDGGRSGIQRWIAYSPLQLLRLRQIRTSFWWNENESGVMELHWLPAMNASDATLNDRGNRSEIQHDGTYVFGEGEQWTNYEFAEYVLKRHMGSNWYLGGQAELLKEISEVIDFGQAPTVQGVLRKLIRLDYGLDFHVRWRNAGAEPGQTWNAGFEVNVFSLLPEESSFGAVTLPANPERLTLDLTTHRDIDNVTVVPSQDHRYERIRVQGRRVVVCCTLRAAVGTGTLVSRWDTFDETTYKQAGGPLAAGWLNDSIRRHPDLRHVYRQFGAPENWNMLLGNAAPVIDTDGHVVPGSWADYQSVVRRTLPWLPLKERWDYTSWPPTGPALADLRAPAAWVWDDQFDEPALARWTPVEELGMSISVPNADWGVFVQGSPNHLLAKGHWTGASPTDVAPKWDWRTLVATIAFETDQRCGMRYAINENATGPEKVIEVRDAELWYLAPATVVGIDDEGNLEDSGGTGRELRNDTEQLQRVMAGAIARYIQPRYRVSIAFHGLLPLGDTLGKVLELEDGTGDLADAAGVITSVEWDISNRPTTTVKAGFAL